MAENYQTSDTLDANEARSHYLDKASAALSVILNYPDLIAVKTFSLKRVYGKTRT